MYVRMNRGAAVIKVGVVGYGYWGPNLVRNFMRSASSTVTLVCDALESQRTRALSAYPNLSVTGDYQDLIRSKEVEAIVIATPVSSHFSLAFQALEAGKHVFVEKPMASTSSQCEQLIELAEKKGLTLHVDHTFVYTGAVQKICAIVNSGEIGELLYYDSIRVNLGLFQHDVNVLWDLAVHDLSILGAISKKEPRAVSATGISHVKDQPENIAFLTVFYDDPLIAHINVNWLAPLKVRRTLIGGSKKMVVFDDLSPSESIKVYDKGVSTSQNPEDIYKLKVSYRSGEMYSPRVELTEALLTEAEHFIDCIVTGKRSATGGEEGLKVVKILEASERSLKMRGGVVEF
jgi:predicted dehydrogenase